MTERCFGFGCAIRTPASGHGAGVDMTTAVAEGSCLAHGRCCGPGRSVRRGARLCSVRGFAVNDSGVWIVAIVSYI